MNDWTKNARKTIRQSLLTTLPIIFVAIAIPFIAIFVPALMPEKETIATWFQRSGAIVVALAVWVEIKNNAISGYIYPSGLSSGEFAELKESYGLYFNIIKWSGFVLAICGTVIWGYGDIPFK